MGALKPHTVHLLVSLYGRNSSVAVRRLPNAPRGGEVLVLGRSFGDVVKAIEQAALESQGRGLDPAPLPSTHTERNPV